VKREKLDIARDRALLKNPSRWGHDVWDRRRVCMKTIEKEKGGDMPARFGVVYEKHPYTIYVHYVGGEGPLAIARIERYASVDAMLKEWMVD
jgi:hypothetical protein